MAKLQEAKRLHALELSLPGNDAGPRVLLSMLSPLQNGFLFTTWKIYVVILDKCKTLVEGTNKASLLKQAILRGISVWRIFDLDC